MNTSYFTSYTTLVNINVDPSKDTNSKISTAPGVDDRTGATPPGNLNMVPKVRVLPPVESWVTRKTYFASDLIVIALIFLLPANVTLDTPLQQFHIIVEPSVSS